MTLMAPQAVPEAAGQATDLDLRVGARELHRVELALLLQAQARHLVLRGESYWSDQ